MFRNSLLLILLPALVSAASEARGQSTDDARSATRARASSMPRRSLRARREGMFLKFDSLRYELEHERLSDVDRERLADEIQRTVLALQESLDDGMRVRAGASGAASGAGPAEGVRHAAPQIAIALRAVYPARGYLGVTFDGPSVEIWRDNQHLIRFLDHPKIALVEPSSPAERAGVQGGDTLLALNGYDVVNREFSFTKLLLPDHRVIVRVRRAGSARDLRVKIEEAPSYVMKRWEPLPPFPPIPPTVSTYPGEDPPMVATRPMFFRGPLWIGDDEGAVAGARLESVTEGLGRALGTKSGLLVLRCAPGSPAFESGLRDGDVIQSAAGKAVHSGHDLRLILLGRDRDGGVKLVILRDRRLRDLTLRW